MRVSPLVLVACALATALAMGPKKSAVGPKKAKKVQRRMEKKAQREAVRASAATGLGVVHALHTTSADMEETSVHSQDDVDAEMLHAPGAGFVAHRESQISGVQSSSSSTAESIHKEDEGDRERRVRTLSLQVPENSPDTSDRAYTFSQGTASPLVFDAHGNPSGLHVLTSPASFDRDQQLRIQAVLLNDADVHLDAPHTADERDIFPSTPRPSPVESTKCGSRASPVRSARTLQSPGTLPIVLGDLILGDRVLAPVSKDQVSAQRFGDPQRSESNNEANDEALSVHDADHATPIPSKSSSSDEERADRETSQGIHIVGDIESNLPADTQALLQLAKSDDVHEGNVAQFSTIGTDFQVRSMTLSAFDSIYFNVSMLLGRMTGINNEEALIEYVAGVFMKSLVAYRLAIMALYPALRPDFVTAMAQCVPCGVCNYAEFDTWGVFLITVIGEVATRPPFEWYENRSSANEREIEAIVTMFERTGFSDTQLAVSDEAHAAQASMPALAIRYVRRVVRSTSNVVRALVRRGRYAAAQALDRPKRMRFAMQLAIKTMMARHPEHFGKETNTYELGAYIFTQSFIIALPLCIAVMYSSLFGIGIIEALVLVLCYLYETLKANVGHCAQCDKAQAVFDMSTK